MTFAKRFSKRRFIPNPRNVRLLGVGDVCIPPRLVSEQPPKRHGYLQVLISLRTGRGRAREPEYLTAHFHKLRDGIAGLISYQFAKGKRHGFDHARCMSRRRPNSP
jgi:hypothetical protein